MPDSALWMPRSDIQAVFERLVESPGQTGPASLEASGQAALALALAYGVADPNGAIGAAGPAEQVPLLHGVLRGLATQNAEGFSSNAVRAWEAVSSDPAEPLPPNWSSVAARERLAVWLVHQGADPWAKDAEGFDALDWAIAAQARSLFHALMGHPACPPLETLHARTSRRAGREIPWLHTLAYFNGTALFDDLVERGWDPMRPDKNGWPPPAWANTPKTLSALLEKNTDEENAQIQSTLEKAWFRRETQKLVHTHFDRKKLESTLKEFACLSEQEKADVSLFNLAEACLAANPSKANYHYKGVKWADADSAQAKEVERLLTARFDWRKTEKSGAAKGVWSLAGACVWGAVRGERERKAEKNLSEVLARVLNNQPLVQRAAWLDEAIRPGVTNAGLLAWGVGGEGDEAFRTLLTPGATGQEAAQLRLTAATRLVETWWSTSSSREWGDVLSRNWHRLASADGAWKGPGLEPWVLASVLAMAQRDLFRPQAALYGNLVGQAERQAAMGTEAGWRKAYEIASAILPMSLDRVPDVKSCDNRHKTEWVRLVRLRKELSQTLEAALRAHPAWAAETASAPFLFSKKARDETDLPEPARWEAFLRQCSLTASMADGDTPARGARRPRM